MKTSKNFFTIAGYRNGNVIGYVDTDGKLNYSENLDLNSRKQVASEEEAEEFINDLLDNESEDLAPDFSYVAEEEQYFFTLEETHLTKLPSGHGHWKVTGESNGFSHTITTNNSQLIDDAFNSEEGDTSYYDSVEEAREAIIELLND